MSTDHFRDLTKMVLRFAILTPYTSPLNSELFVISPAFSLRRRLAAGGRYQYFQSCWRFFRKCPKFLTKMLLNPFEDGNYGK